MLACSTLWWQSWEVGNTVTAVCLRLGGAGHYWKHELPFLNTEEKTGPEKSGGLRVSADPKLEPECPLYKVAFHSGSPNTGWDVLNCQSACLACTRFSPRTAQNWTWLVHTCSPSLWEAGVEVLNFKVIVCHIQRPAWGPEERGLNA